jgi:hypothetical protein
MARPVRVVVLMVDPGNLRWNGVPSYLQTCCQARAIPDPQHKAMHGPGLLVPLRLLSPRQQYLQELDLAGLEDDPDFWNMTLDSNSDDTKHDIKDTAAASNSRVSVAVSKTQPLPTPAAVQPRPMANGAYE